MTDTTQPPAETLVPCPFCKWTAPNLTPIRDGRVVRCPNCGARGAPCFHGRADQPSADDRAIAAWNAAAVPHRAGGDAIPAGEVVVPRVATRAMVDAADACPDAYSAWAAMVEASHVR